MRETASRSAGPSGTEQRHTGRAHRPGRRVADDAHARTRGIAGRVRGHRHPRGRRIPGAGSVRGRVDGLVFSRRKLCRLIVKPRERRLDVLDRERLARREQQRLQDLFQIECHAGNRGSSECARWEAKQLRKRGELSYANRSLGPLRGSAVTPLTAGSASHTMFLASSALVVDKTSRNVVS